MAKQQCFVTIKDHKPDFRTNPKYRLLNPTKSELGKLSKHILQTVNTELRNKIKVKQWQNSSEVIEWFKNIPNKKECTFFSRFPNLYQKGLNSCNEDIFRKSTLFYNSILQDCGFNENIKYCPEESVSSRRRKNRSRNIIWYNPPFSRNVKMNAGKHFFTLLKKHFGKNHKYHKIFNKNNVKVSYSCMDNMKKVLTTSTLLPKRIK